MGDKISIFLVFHNFLLKGMTLTSVVGPEAFFLIKNVYMYFGSILTLSDQTAVYRIGRVN